jgi:hypothetical protein
MYRDPSLSLAETIARLEAEVVELRALGGKRRERRLVMTTVISMVVAVHAVMACLATKVHADRLQRDALHRLNGRAGDLVSCVHALDARNREIEARRAAPGELCRCPGVADPEWALSIPVAW